MRDASTACLPFHLTSTPFSTSPHLTLHSLFPLFFFSFLIFFPCILSSLSWSDTLMTVKIIFFYTNTYNNLLCVNSNFLAPSMDFKTNFKFFFEFYFLPESEFLKIKCFVQWNVWDYWPLLRHKIFWVLKRPQHRGWVLEKRCCGLLTLRTLQSVPFCLCSNYSSSVANFRNPVYQTRVRKNSLSSEKNHNDSWEIYNEVDILGISCRTMMRNLWVMPPLRVIYQISCIRCKNKSYAVAMK